MSEGMDLARRAVACKHWRWMPGMVCIDPETGHDYRMLGHTMLGPKVVELAFGRKPNAEEDGIVTGLDDRLQHAFTAGPDLTDPATLGCLLALVREAWEDPTLFVYSNGYTCAVQGAWRGPFFESETEAEALIAALEAAP